jgi:hypothetical protein
LSARDLAYAAIHTKMKAPPGRRRKPLELRRRKPDEPAAGAATDDAPRLAQWAAELGVYALSVRHAGLSGRTDAFLWRYAFQNDLRA